MRLYQARQLLAPKVCDWVGQYGAEECPNIALFDVVGLDSDSLKSDHIVFMCGDHVEWALAIANGDNPRAEQVYRELKGKSSMTSKCWIVVRNNNLPHFGFAPLLHPSTNPVAHTTLETARREAERLTKQANGAASFIVFEAVGAAIPAAAPVKWEEIC